MMFAGAHSDGPSFTGCGSGSRARAYRLSRGGCQWPAGLVVLFLLGSASQALAAGFWTYDKGTSLFGRAGANVATPVDPAAAMLTNPAALAGLPGLQLMIDGDLFFDFRRWARAPDNFDLDGDGVGDGERTYDEVRNSFRPYRPSPGLFASYNLARLRLPELTIGAAVHGPVLVHAEFPADGPQRYSQIDNRPLEIHYALGAGYQLPWLGLRLGANLIMISQIFDNTLALNTFFSYPEEPGYDAIVHVRTSQHFIPVGQFAAALQPYSGVTIAASFRTQWDVDSDGEAEITLGNQLEEVAMVEGNRLRGLLKMPPVLRAAVEYRDPEARFEVEAALTYEWWSRNRDVIFRPEGIRVVPVPGYEFLLPDGPIAISDIVIESRYRNTYVLALGGEARVLPDRLLARAGVFYSRASVGKGRLNLGTMDLDRLGGTVGARVELPWHLWLDFAFGYVQMFEKTVENGKTRLKNPLTVPPTDTWPVADGVYGGYQLDFQVALGAAFDV